MQSAIYSGVVRHRRLTPRFHGFRYRLFMLYLDLAELPELLAGSSLCSTHPLAVCRYRREDFLGDPELPLDQAVRDLVENDTGQRPAGPIRLLTNLRYFGVLTNPISCYYCFDESGTRVETLVAQVTNTPWRERHAYVLPVDPDEKIQRTEFDKQMHVSPFNPMAMHYAWKSRQPGSRLGIHLELLDGDAKQFDATLALKRSEMSASSLRRMVWSYPWMSLKILVAIYWEALRLAIKRVPFHAHTAPLSLNQGINND